MNAIWVKQGSSLTAGSWWLRPVPLPALNLFMAR